MNELEEILKHEFKNADLLTKALTHSSYNPDVEASYERLEFLGDRVLGLAIASLLYDLFPLETEGSLAQRHTALVCRETVAQVAKTLQLGRFMLVANDSIRENDAMLCDVCEAIIGAIFKDSGCGDAIKFVNNHWRELIDKNMAPPKDAKTTLQEVSHIKGYGQPRYVITGRKGSEHEPIFFIDVELNGGLVEKGCGHSKKIAEFDAATKMLERINK